MRHKIRSSSTSLGSVRQLLICALLTSPTEASAWEYELTWQSGLLLPEQRLLCREYLNNLNSIKAPPHMTCERQVNPNLGNFDKPEWESLDPRDHIAVVKEIFLQFRETWAFHQWNEAGGYAVQLKKLFPQTPTVEKMQALKLTLPGLREVWEHARSDILEKIWEEEGLGYLSRVKNEYESGNYKLGRAQFDLDNYEGPDTVYRLGTRSCFTKNLTQEQIEQLDAGAEERTVFDQREYSFGWSYFVLRADNKRLSFRHLPARVDTFTYKSRTYFDSWIFTPYWRNVALPPLTVYNSNWVTAGRGGLAIRAVCKFSYRPEPGDSVPRPTAPAARQ